MISRNLKINLVIKYIIYIFGYSYLNSANMQIVQFLHQDIHRPYPARRPTRSKSVGAVVPVGFSIFNNYNI